jgi:hypothetical protein
MPETLAPDFAGVARELENARRNIWPGLREERWREFQERERPSPIRRLLGAEG